MITYRWSHIRGVKYNSGGVHKVEQQQGVAVQRQREVARRRVLHQHVHHGPVLARQACTHSLLPHTKHSLSVHISHKGSLLTVIYCELAVENMVRDRKSPNVWKKAKTTEVLASII